MLLTFWIVFIPSLANFIVAVVALHILSWPFSQGQLKIESCHVALLCGNTISCHMQTQVEVLGRDTYSPVQLEDAFSRTQEMPLWTLHVLSTSFLVVFLLWDSWTEGWDSLCPPLWELLVLSWTNLCFRERPCVFVLAAWLAYT